MLDQALLREIQNQLGARDRDLLAQAIARRRPALSLPPALVERFAPAVRQLREEGAVSLGAIFPPRMCDRIRAHLLAEPCYPSHVPVYAKAAPRPMRFEDWNAPYGSYATRSVLEAPGFLSAVLSEPVMGTAVPYFGCLPLVYSVNTFWTLPGRGGAFTHGYHRDLDDVRFLSVFVYWTDVAAGEGEFRFLARSHDYRMAGPLLEASPVAAQVRGMNRDLNLFDTLRFLDRGGSGYGQDVLLEAVFAGCERSFAGPRGTAVAADTFGLHRGTPPATQPRLVTWIRFGLYENAAYATDRNRAPALRPDVEAQLRQGPLAEMFSLLLPA